MMPVAWVVHVAVCSSCVVFFPSLSPKVTLVHAFEDWRSFHTGTVNNGAVK